MKVCNARLNIPELEGCDIRCDLPSGHTGLHEHRYTTKQNGSVVTTFQKGVYPILVKKLRHIIPEEKTEDGENVGCYTKEGKRCQFAFFVGSGDEERYQCFLSRDKQAFYADEFTTGCSYWLWVQEKN